MNSHDRLQELLALSAAGALDPDGERSVREHVRDCGECAARLEEFSRLAGDLAALSVPVPSPDLMLRTQVLVAAEFAARADSRQGAVLAALAGVLGWGTSVVTAYLCQAALGGSIWTWLSWCTAVGLLSAPAAAALYRSQRNSERSAL